MISKVEYTKSFMKDFERLSIKDKEGIVGILTELEYFPDVKNLKKLKTYKQLYRVRSGNYRILMHTEELPTLTVFAVKQRKDIYKNLS